MSERTDTPAPADAHADVVFDVGSADAYEKQRRIHRFLSQETRNHIIQVLLGHPSHLASITELDYFIPKSRSTIREQLDNLAERNIVSKYHHEPNEGTRGLPTDFWGPTEFGVELLYEYKYLRGVPIMRSLHDHTAVTAQVERHLNAPRPDLPAAVAESLEFEEVDVEESESASERIVALREESLFAENSSGKERSDSPIDELF